MRFGLCRARFSMFSSSDPDVMKSPAKGQSRSLNKIKLPPEIQPGQYKTITNSKLPLVIPASATRKRTEPLERSRHRRGRFIFPGILLGSLLVVALASLFVVPLD